MQEKQKLLPTTAVELLNSKNTGWEGNKKNGKHTNTERERESRIPLVWKESSVCDISASNFQVKEGINRIEEVCISISHVALSKDTDCICNWDQKERERERVKKRKMGTQGSFAK